MPRKYKVNILLYLVNDWNAHTPQCKPYAQQRKNYSAQRGKNQNNKLKRQSQNLLTVCLFKLLNYAFWSLKMFMKSAWKLLDHNNPFESRRYFEILWHGAWVGRADGRLGDKSMTELVSPCMFKDWIWWKQRGDRANKKGALVRRCCHLMLWRNPKIFYVTMGSEDCWSWGHQGPMR